MEELRQLKQRVALRCDLPALDIHETAAYISGRVAIAGGDSRTIFTAAAVRTIYERSRGIPRTISVICDNALLTGFATGVKLIGSDLVLEVCRDFRLPQYKVTELKPVRTPGSSAVPGPSAAQPEPTNGNGRRANVVLPVPDVTPSSRDEDMFSHYTKKKRFSFFG